MKAVLILALLTTLATAQSNGQDTGLLVTVSDLVGSVLRVAGLDGSGSGVLGGLIGNKGGVQSGLLGSGAASGGLLGAVLGGGEGGGRGERRQPEIVASRTSSVGVGGLSPALIANLLSLSQASHGQGSRSMGAASVGVISGDETLEEIKGIDPAAFQVYVRKQIDIAQAIKAAAGSAPPASEAAATVSGDSAGASAGAEA